MTTMRIPTPFAAEDGAMSVVNLFFILAVGMLSGVAIDVSNLMSARTQLQTAADAAAHAALVEREWHDMETSRETAMQILQANMPTSVYGDVLDEEAIQFGEYDRATKVFTPDEDSRDAVMVETSRLSSNGNPVGTFLLHLVGLTQWDVKRQSVFETFFPTCLMEGFVAQGVVDIQSNNSYFNGFCIHSNSHVEINQNNFFEAGTIVSMPDTDDLVVPNDGLSEEKNEGLEKALREGRWFIKILDRLDRVRQGVQMERQPLCADLHQELYGLLTLTRTTVNPSRLHCGPHLQFDLAPTSLPSTPASTTGIVVIAECADDVQGRRRVQERGDHQQEHRCQVHVGAEQPGPWSTRTTARKAEARSLCPTAASKSRPSSRCTAARSSPPATSNFRRQC